MAWDAPSSKLFSLSRVLGGEPRNVYAPRVAVDGFHELGRWDDQYEDADRRTSKRTYIGRFQSDSEAIEEWRRMLREGEL